MKSRYWHFLLLLQDEISSFGSPGDSIQLKCSTESEFPDDCRFVDPSGTVYCRQNDYGASDCIEGQVQVSWLYGHDT